MRHQQRRCRLGCGKLCEAGYWGGKEGYKDHKKVDKKIEEPSTVQVSNGHNIKEKQNLFLGGVRSHLERKNTFSCRCFSFSFYRAISVFLHQVFCSFFNILPCIFQSRYFRSPDLSFCIKFCIYAVTFFSYSAIYFPTSLSLSPTSLFFPSCAIVFQILRLSLATVLYSSRYMCDSSLHLPCDLLTYLETPSERGRKYTGIFSSTTARPGKSIMSSPRT